MRLAEPIGKKGRIFFPLLTQNNLLASDFSIHTLLQTFLIQKNLATIIA
ncbi:hypothetical protein BACCAP_02224 [Pseudoflavonifractor capillosus ATCC 29799]|uniref:Uncharacterized protein n=1 Tax=Pseudoflavonifractor capillosus ATCC 29799 TaxID=411467 RepID=A6NVI4_9FIRM|nr:hypothetical protein BACCAP_02224 [Pseudoflavonifractor capillosus ATCC 29799]